MKLIGAALLTTLLLYTGAGVQKAYAQEKEEGPKLSAPVNPSPVERRVFETPLEAIEAYHTAVHQGDIASIVEMQYHPHIYDTTLTESEKAQKVKRLAERVAHHFGNMTTDFARVVSDASIDKNMPAVQVFDKHVFPKYKDSTVALLQEVSGNKDMYAHYAQFFETLMNRVIHSREEILHDDSDPDMCESYRIVAVHYFPDSRSAIHVKQYTEDFVFYTVFHLKNSEGNWLLTFDSWVRMDAAYRLSRKEDIRQHLLSVMARKVPDGDVVGMTYVELQGIYPLNKIEVEFERLKAQKLKTEAE
jgi:hypothetical protein